MATLLTIQPPYNSDDRIHDLKKDQPKILFKSKSNMDLLINCVLLHPFPLVMGAYGYKANLMFSNNTFQILWFYLTQPNTLYIENSSEIPVAFTERMTRGRALHDREWIAERPGPPIGCSFKGTGSGCHKQAVGLI